MHRYHQLPKNIEQTIETMRSGIAKNLTAHLASMQVHYQTKISTEAEQKQSLANSKVQPWVILASMALSES